MVSKDACSINAKNKNQNNFPMQMTSAFTHFGVFQYQNALLKNVNKKILSQNLHTQRRNEMLICK